MVPYVNPGRAIDLFLDEENKQVWLGLSSGATARDDAERVRRGTTSASKQSYGGMKSWREFGTHQSFVRCVQAPPTT